jgi:hypothetical protein
MDTEVCRYNADHQAQHVPAVTTIDGGAVAGLVPACQECADLYSRAARRSPADAAITRTQADADRTERNRQAALRHQERDGQ